MHPFWFLLLSPPAPKIEPMFKSQRELAKLMCVARGITDEKKWRPMAVFLNQIIKGDRPLPEVWKPFLQEVINERALERGLNPPSIALLKRTYEQDRHSLAALILEQEAARDTLILNATPLELTDAGREHPEAVHLQECAITALSEGRRYHYCVANQASGRRLLQALVRAVERFNRTDASQLVYNWMKSGLLEISTVPEILLLHPTVAFNTIAPDHLSVFVWHAPYDWQHCLWLPLRQSASWLGKVQNVLDAQAEPVPFPS